MGLHVTEAEIRAIFKQFEKQVDAARRGDQEAMRFLRRFGPHAIAIERVRDLEAQLEKERAWLLKGLPRICSDHLDETSGGGEAWVRTCVLCGRTELS